MKLNATQTHVKVPLSSLRVTTNVRTDFDETEIAELAASIKENGLINAITVKPPVTDENGDKTYEVIAGGRRIRAHQWLCDHGDDFSLIDCKISTGDMWTIQMIENIQRTDLTQREKENAIARALDEGMSQTEIAEKLSKPQSYISDIVAGMKVRRIADEKGISTDTISTKALAQLRSIPEDDLPQKITQLTQMGGTVADATNILKSYRFFSQQEQADTTPTTPESNEETEIDIDEQTEWEDEEICPSDSTIPLSAENRFNAGDIVSAAGGRIFFDDLKIGMQFVHATDEHSNMYLRVCEITDINSFAERFWYKSGDQACDRKGSCEKKYIDGETCEHDAWIFSIPSEASLIKGYEKPKKKPDSFNWFVKNATVMESVMLTLPGLMKKMPLDTKICVQAGSKTAEISSVIYEPEENRLVFRCLENFGIH